MLSQRGYFDLRARAGEVLTGGKKAFGMLVAGPKNLTNDGKFVDDSEKACGKRLDKLFERMRIGTAGHKKEKRKADEPGGG